MEWKPGDHYICRAPDGLTIYGVIEKSPYPEDWPVEESMAKHGIYVVRAWSIACPDGEMGTEHVRNMVKVTEETFLWAQEHDWPTVGIPIGSA
jgi:hypothetical protein